MEVEFTKTGCWLLLTTGGTALSTAVLALWKALGRCRQEHVDDLRRATLDVRRLRGR